ncbi:MULTISPECIES: DUF2735 domain-containing protein [unclassified Agrobacterium]|uniref:DUF2735 domain-containing protein n=1 Tax=unclassified Agrobacterium TaxID=2632611 RepID=UPI00069ADD21|nr:MULTISPECIES: DUF2735 domain-containing protein [unclassified Agrobacterium]KNY35240.1 glutamine synthetase [Agrobacterium sp. SUL3]MCD4660275.1 DUF2735 domain-containing protein [Agrobacterium sp.]
MIEMATGIHRETATIYQFPVGGRAGLSRFGNSGLSELELQAREPHVDFGSWYHDEAIRDEERGDKPHS